MSLLSESKLSSCSCRDFCAWLGRKTKKPPWTKRSGRNMTVVPPELPQPRCCSHSNFTAAVYRTATAHLLTEDGFLCFQIAAGKVLFTRIHSAEFPLSSAHWER